MKAYIKVSSIKVVDISGFDSFLNGLNYSFSDTILLLTHILFMALSNAVLPSTIQSIMLVIPVSIKQSWNVLT